MKKIYKIFALVPVLYLIIIPVYFAITSFSKPCTGIKITVTDSSEYHSVTKREILNLVNGKNKKLIGTPVKEIAVSEIEDRIHTLRELRVAEVYVSIDGIIHVYADQRNPVMRVMARDGGDYYVDEEGVVVRRRLLYTPRLHIVGGNVNITRAMLDGVSVLDTAIKNTILKDIYYLVNYINSDRFWSAQIDQIFVDSHDEIDLIPRVGSHMIHLGSTENLETKFRNLETFYDKVLPEVGWNKYSLINLEFRDQIVCKRRN